MSVFGALNRFISRLDGEAGSQHRDGTLGQAAGFQILRNKSDQIQLEPWFDFVVGINGRQIEDPSPHLFATEVRNCAGAGVTLAVWSAKGQVLRDVYIPIPKVDPALGVSLLWTSLSITENVWHILEVIPNSPADLAGLLPYGDYIIGTPEGSVYGEAGLGELVEEFLARPLRLHVYNHEYGVTRPVTITPSRNWGGEGALGCVLGFGALHRLPASLNEPPAAPGDTLFETARFSNEEARSRNDSPARSASSKVPSTAAAGTPSASLLVPATMPIAPSTMSNPAAPPPNRKPRAPAASPSRGFDEYWKESEEKSKEEDFAPSKKAAAPPPPPPSKLGVSTQSPNPPPSAGEPRQTRSPAPIPSDDDEGQPGASSSTDEKVTAS